MGFGIELCERGLVPDSITRKAIQKLLRARLAETDKGSSQANDREASRLADEFKQGPIALVPEKANEQHYEVPAELFGLMLGPVRKYSCCYWDDTCKTLGDAEQLALAETCSRADLKDGQKILELGCGWGSLSLFMAKAYPGAEITCVSNSNSQREYIVSQASSAGMKNLQVITCDINDFQVQDRFDRVVSVEMFEHMRNYESLLRRIANWLADDGKLFVHIFCHKDLTYEFRDKSDNDWMSRYFFSGGIMPGQNFLRRFNSDLQVAKQWNWNGVHYQKTCEAWLVRMDRNKSQIMPVLERAYGKEASRWFNRWRMFHLACSELFGFENGNEWFVSHYLFEANG